MAYDSSVNNCSTVDFNSSGIVFNPFNAALRTSSDYLLGHLR